MFHPFSLLSSKPPIITIHEFIFEVRHEHEKMFGIIKIRLILLNNPNESNYFHRVEIRIYVMENISSCSHGDICEGEF